MACFCCGAVVSNWPEAADQGYPLYGRFRGKSGR